MNILEDINFSQLNGFASSAVAQYDEYVHKHINNVKNAYILIKKYCPSILDNSEISIDELDKQIDAHDKSKFSEEELEPYAEHYYGKNKGLSTEADPAFEKAWQHHYENNPHHPEYWGKGTDMPYSCLIEMLCDLFSFSILKKDYNEFFSYWLQSRDEKHNVMSENSFDTLDNMISMFRSAIENKPIDESIFFKTAEDRALKDGKKEAVDAVVTSRARHLADNKAKDPDTPKNLVGEYKYLAKKLGSEKVENLVKMVNDADRSNDKISVDIASDKGNTKSITGDFEGKSHMSLHVIKGSNPILDRDRKGRTKSTGYGENDEFIKKNTGENIKDLAKDKFDAEKRKIGLAENIRESELSDDLSAIYGPNSTEIQKISDVLNNIKDIKYGFIDKTNNNIIDNRDEIHSMTDLSDHYETNFNPEITLKDKLGICLDQSLVVQYLLKRYHPDMPCEIYTLVKGRFGHAVPCFIDDSKWYYLENAWDKEKGLHGPFMSRDELEKYLSYVYHKNHDKDNDDDVLIRTYSDYLKN